jgi:glycosyltransferase involved in cell wall biosynthesis
LGNTQVIPNWADPDLIYPIEKKSNWFAREHKQIERLTVLYSGTIGIKHNIGVMIQAAVKSKNISDINYLFIGRGEGYQDVAQIIDKEKLSNTILLPLQPESTLPYSLSTGDIAVIALDRGGEGIYVPSKTYYAMAAGSAIILIGSQENEIAEIIKHFNCGLIVPPDDVDAFMDAIYHFRKDNDFLETCRLNARQAVLQKFNRDNCTNQYIYTLRTMIRNN